MTPWLDPLRTRCATAGDACLVTIAHIRGSAPRDPGAKMLVDPQGLTGTIGGGRLEHECTKLACAELSRDGAAAFTRTFPLGANLGQCCGGVVEVLFERVSAETPWIRDLLDCHDQRTPAVVATAFDANGNWIKQLITADDCRTYGAESPAADDITAVASRLLNDGGPAERIRVPAGDGTTLPVLFEPIGPPAMSIALFGAGHVGSAVVAAMAGLDCEIRWIDARRRVFPPSAPGNVTMIESVDPAREIAAMPPGAFYLVMTHSHPLDYEICEAVLERGDFAYVGLIGSRAKRRRFENLMKKQGMASSLLEKLTCPIGIRGIGGKRPAEIAIAVAAELLKAKMAMSGAGSIAADHKNVHVLRRP